MTPSAPAAPALGMPPASRKPLVRFAHPACGMLR